MGKRRKAREYVMKLLYSKEKNPSHKGDLLKDIGDIAGYDGETKDFVEHLYLGVIENKEKIDKTVLDVCENWDLDRMNIIDKVLIRMGVYEMLFMKENEEIPPVVSINEAVEIAKGYSTNESGKFVNGVLDEVRKKCTGEKSKTKDQSQE